MHREVLGGGDCAKVSWIVTLQSGHESNGHAAGKKWIFSISFLTAAPPRIAEDIYVRGPEVQALEKVAASSANRHVVPGSSLCPDSRGDVMKYARVEGGSQS